MQKEIYLIIEGEPGQEVQVWYRGNRDFDSEEANIDDAAPIVFTGRLGSDGRVTVRVPRAYLCVGFPERRGCVPADLHEETGESKTVRLESGKNQAASDDLQNGETSESEAIKQPGDHDYAAQLEIEAEALAANASSILPMADVRPWRVAKSLLALRDQINQRAPGRSKASDGTIGDIRHCGSPTSSSDHCPRITDGGSGVVAAMDITHDPGRGCDANAIAEAIRASRDSRVKYIIWNRQICNSSPINGAAAWQWRRYTGSNGHTHHVHISVKADRDQYDSTKSWSI